MRVCVNYAYSSATWLARSARKVLRVAKIMERVLKTSKKDGETDGTSKKIAES